jgi:hypothetical protein
MCHRHYVLEWSKRNPERNKELARQRLIRRDKTAHRKNWKKEYNLAYRKTEHGQRVIKRCNVRHMKRRREAIRLATPPWADLAAIKSFYDNCPPGHTVDHIIPVLGKSVRGLHIVENFQYLTFDENKRKGNRFK